MTKQATWILFACLALLTTTMGHATEIMPESAQERPRLPAGVSPSEAWRCEPYSSPEGHADLYGMCGPESRTDDEGYVDYGSADYATLLTCCTCAYFLDYLGTPWGRGNCAALKEVFESNLRKFQKVLETTTKGIK